MKSGWFYWIHSDAARIERILERARRPQDDPDRLLFNCIGITKCFGVPDE